MIRAGVGHSANPSTSQAAVQAATEALSRAGINRADLVIVFFTAEHVPQREELIATLTRTARTDCIVGSSATGVLTGDGEIEGSPGIAVMALGSDQLLGRPFILEPLRGNEENLGATIGTFLAKTEDRSSLMVLFPDTYSGQPQRLLHGIENKAGFHPVVGAGSSENGVAGATFQLCGGKIATNAVAGVYLCGDFQTHLDITQGCQPITEPMVITKAEKNLILEIDNRPALEVFARQLKGPLAQDLRRALMYLFVGLPADRAENSVVPGKYVVRNIIGLDPAKGILGVAEEVREGQAMIFTFRDGQRARDDLNQMLQRQAANLGGKKPAFGLYFNCCARGSSLYGIPGIDSAYIRQALGEFPLIGMFGGYELAPLGRANHLFAYTGVLALISE
jgi:small ligand-binding sensory domain FIST